MDISVLMVSMFLDFISVTLELAVSKVNLNRPVDTDLGQYFQLLSPRQSLDEGVPLQLQVEDAGDPDGAPYPLQAEQGNLRIITVLETNREGGKEGGPGQLEHGLHMLVVGGSGEGQLHMAGGLHEHLGSL